MRKRFIVLVDFSEHSEWLLSFSSKWAKEVNAELLLIHCSLVLVSGMADHDVREQAMRSSERTTLEKLQSYAHGILGADPTIQFKIESHNLAAALLDLQQHDVTDYVFVGMNDKSPIENFFIGNTASVLAEELNSIIIALPTFRHDFSFERLYIGVKHSYQLKDTELQSLLSIRKSIIEQLNFVNVLKPGEPHEEIEQYLKSLCAAYGKDIRTSYEIIEKESIASSIKEYMRENNGVLVIQKGSRSFMDMFRRFFTKEIIDHAEIPVIILP